MGYLLDTCVISELRKPHCQPCVLSWFSGVQPSEVYLSVLTLGEIHRGIESHRLKDARAAGALERWLESLELHYADRLLPVSSAIADRWGRLCLQQPLPSVDGLIAATALEHRLTLVTRNTGDFERSGVNVLNPFS